MDMMYFDKSIIKTKDLNYNIIKGGASVVLSTFRALTQLNLPVTF